MDKYLYWLDACYRLGNATKAMLMETYGDAKAVYYENRRKLATMIGEEKEEIIWQMKKCWDVDKEYEKIVKDEIGAVIYGMQGYPGCSVLSILQRAFATGGFTLRVSDRSKRLFGIWCVCGEGIGQRTG